MRVTDLKTQQKNINRINVFIDGEYSFSLEVSQVVDFGIKIGKIFDAKAVEAFKLESEFGKLYSRALDYCLMRPHSSREIQDYLYKKTITKKIRSRITGKVIEHPGSSQFVVEKVYERLANRGHIDDKKFTMFWIQNRKMRQGISRRKLSAELIAKGVEKSIVESCFAESDRNDKNEIQKVILKKQGKYQDRNKLMRYLHSLGFSYEEVKNAMSELTNPS